MRKLMIASLMVFSVFLMVKCSPKASTAIASLPVETKDQIAAKYTADQLENGKTIFMNNCDKCHKLKEPASRTPEGWNKVLKRMIPKAKLSDDDGKLVRAYLIANSKSS